MKRPRICAVIVSNDLETIKEIEPLIDLFEARIDLIGNLSEAIGLIKPRAKCLVSFHDLKGTPPFNEMKAMVQRQLDAGADVCKLVTTARSLEDNVTVLQLISAFPNTKIVSMAMGHLGLTSRILCPLVGGDFTYASIEKGKESAAG